MTRSWDPDIHHDSDWSHAQWKHRLFMKVILRRLRSPPTGGIEEEVREPEHYVLGSKVGPQESDNEG